MTSSPPCHVLQDQDETGQDGYLALQALYPPVERKDHRRSEASEGEDEDEDEGVGQGIPLSISE